MYLIFLFNVFTDSLWMSFLCPLVLQRERDLWSYIFVEGKDYIILIRLEGFLGVLQILLKIVLPIESILCLFIL